MAQQASIEMKNEVKLQRVFKKIVEIFPILERTLKPIEQKILERLEDATPDKEVKPIEKPVDKKELTELYRIIPKLMRVLQKSP
jgi:hypothetical protein